MNELSGIWLCERRSDRLGVRPGVRPGVRASDRASDRSPALRVFSATGPRRVTGLIGRPPQESGEALLFARCRSVHGMFMSRRIDVIFLDSGLRVLRTAGLRPWRIVFCKQAAHVLELRDGACRQLGIATGDRFIVSPADRRRSHPRGRMSAAKFEKETC